MNYLEETKWKIHLSLFGLLFCMVACAANPVTGRHELMLISEPDEIRLGQRTDGQIAQAYGRYDDPKLGAYIADLGRRLAKVSHRAQLPFEFKVLDSPVVNAFAVPGGYVYLTRGILSYCNSEAELAGVMGHEIGHVAARHSAQQYARAQLAQLGLGLGAILSESFGQLAGLAQFGVSTLFLKFSRDNERQADDLGVEYATRVGFNADQMANFFETLERLHPSSDRSGLPGWFSTHPNPEDRIGAVQRKAQEWAQRLGSPQLQVNREAYLHQIDGLVFGEDPRQGYVADDIFYHPELRFQFPVPSGWKLNNTPTQVQIVNERRDALILFSLKRGRSPEAVGRQFISESKARVIRFDAITVNALPAQRLMAYINAQEGPLGITAYFIQKDEHVYVFQGVTPQALFREYRPAFAHTMGGFKTLSDPERINVEPERVRIRTIGRSATLQKVLETLGVQEKRLEEMAQLNGRRLTDTIPANTLLKVVMKGK